jgi:hypothetical protein
MRRRRVGAAALELAIQSVSEPLSEEFWDWYPLRVLFGDSPSARLMQFLSIHCTADYTLEEVARQTHAQYGALNRVARSLLKLRVLRVSRSVGRRVYRLNERSPIVKVFRQLSLEVSMEAARGKLIALE